MRLLFGQAHERTYVDVARQIPGIEVPPSSSSAAERGGCFAATDCGARNCRYLGLDFNGSFVLRARGGGVPTRFFNVLSDPIPTVEYVVMVASLYHFRRRAAEVLDRMQTAATRAVIISEPVHNLSSTPRCWVASRRA